MKTLSLILAALVATTSLAACGRKTEAPAAPAAPAPAAATAPAASNDMAGMDMAPADKMAKGVGVVTAIDKTSGTITLDHEAIPDAGWPAMTMGFKIAPALLDGMSVGDKVAFDLKLRDGAGEVTSIHRQ
ncbi:MULTISPECIES: copper-binding protein [Caulobacter]|jgi:Cu/Ag efflux protein CusF|uniref:Copper-binding protein n=1 Tax=Caulobacter segnis TaxID=88688 RepID=A0A2W5WXJ2_9CAUL|nr:MULTISPECIES: copper-binding protein [Caulobacter]MDR7232664.1 Cu/Ag efflux protein CusF [Caulobacter sp. BE264]PZR32794.1 MAG: copper-binding protein [Caulobacter segnis]